MVLVRTTLRLKENLKKSAEKQALEENTTLQDIFNKALEDYINRQGETAAKKILFRTHDLGEPLDSLRRADYYSNPE